MKPERRRDSNHNHLVTSEYFTLNLPKKDGYCKDSGSQVFFATFGDAVTWHHFHLTRIIFTMQTSFLHDSSQEEKFTLPTIQESWSREMIFQLVIVSFHIFTNKMDIFYWSMIIGGRPKFEGSMCCYKQFQVLQPWLLIIPTLGNRSVGHSRIGL